MRVTLERLGHRVPVPVIVLDRMPGRLVGLSMGLFIIVRSDHAPDRPTIVHELVHCRQFWRGGTVVHMLRYYASRRYRLRSELEAFRAEIAACAPAQRGARLEEAARALANGYHLGLDIHACRTLLECSPPSNGSWPTSRPGAARPSTSSPAVMGRSTDSTAR